MSTVEVEMRGPEEGGPFATPDEAAGDAATSTARSWLDAGAPHVRAVLHFGSTRSGASPGRRSAHDLFLIVDHYAGFYDVVRRRLPGRRSAASLARLNRILPPNVLHGTEPEGETKLFVLSESDLAVAVGPRPRDHFVRARLVQDVAVAAAADDLAAARAASVLAEARRRVVDWMRPFVRAPFDVAALTRRMLELSYASEIRPESAGRAGEVFEAQREFLRRTYAPLLEDAVGEGCLVRRDGAYAYARPAGPLERTAARLWFARSRARATLRWVKYLLTFEGWLDYAVAKVERRTGMKVELTGRERRWPLLFLWPKFFRVMRARHRGAGTREANR